MCSDNLCFLMMPPLSHYLFAFLALQAGLLIRVRFSRFQFDVDFVLLPYGFLGLAYKSTMSYDGKPILGYLVSVDSYPLYSFC